jgi:hypothetical protein
MSAVVWVESWEMQCCGEPFFVGGNASWPIARTNPSDWLNDHFDRLGRALPELEYSRHGVEDPSDQYTLAGLIRSIEALHYGVHVAPDQHHPGVTLIPTAGTQRLTAVQSDQMWELEPKDPMQESFAGWIVEIVDENLEPLEVERHDELS